MESLKLSNRKLSSSKRALLVEDNKIISEVHRKYLEKLGFQVESVENGQDALDRTVSKDYAVMLLDLGLPGISGESVLDAIRAREYTTQKHLPIIIATAHGDEAKLEECLARGADAAFRKPLSFEGLQHTFQLMKLIELHTT